MLKRRFLSFFILISLWPGLVQAYFPNDLDLIKQRYLGQVKAFNAWDLAPGGSPQVIVAVIDTGVDIEHPDLAANIWTNPNEVPDNGIDDDDNGLVDDVHGWNFLDNNNNPRPQIDPSNLLGTNHGTFLAGIIAAAADNSLGIAGLAYKVKIMPLRVLDSQGAGDSLNVVRAIDYAVAKKVDVINLSFQGNQYSQAMDEAITRAWNAGVVVTTAAGNDGYSDSQGNLHHTPVFPACNDQNRPNNTLLGVASVDNQDALSTFSDYGTGCVDLVAPGENFYSTTVYQPSVEPFRQAWGGGFSGTSISVALVSGAAALLKSLDRHLTARQVIGLLLQSSDSIDLVNGSFAGELGAGRLNVFNAIKSLRELQQREATVLVNDLVAIARQGGPQVRFFNGDGQVVSQWFAGSAKERGQWSIAVGRLGQERQPRVVVTAGPGQRPAVRVYSPEGKLQREFLAYASSFRGGVQAAVVDLNGDGIGEIVTLPISQATPQIKVFNDSGKLISQWFAGDRRRIGSWSLAALGAADNHPARIAVAATAGREVGTIRVYNAFAERLGEWNFGLVGKTKPGINITLADFQDNGQLSLVAIPAAPTSGPAPVKVFNLTGKLLNLWEIGGGKGVGYNVAVRRPTNQALPVIVVSPRQGLSDLRLLGLDGKPVVSFTAWPVSFKGGVVVAQ